MGSEINQVGDEVVKALQDAGDSGNTTGVSSSDPPVASPQNSLRQAISLPSDLPSNNQALVVSSNAPRPASSSSRGMKGFLEKFAWRKDPRRASDGENNTREVSPADNTEGEEHFRWASPCVKAEVYGFDEELQALESFVRREKENEGGFRAVAVVGAGGIGKTTLCQLLFNEKGIKEDFVPRIWVSNSRLPFEEVNFKAAIVKRMLTQIGEDETDDMELDQLMALLHRNLWGKKYLIILDDARDADGWYDNLDAVPNMEDDWKDRLAYGLAKGSGGRVVVTGRNEEVARKMVGESNLHKVMPLSDLECCWLIFKESVEKGLDESAREKGLDESAREKGMTVEGMKSEVYKKSAGIPLAAKIMGQITKEQLREESKDRIGRAVTA